MKQIVVATLSMAALLAPNIGASQEMQCVVVCNPPRVYCAPAGSPLPPIYDLCKRSPYSVAAENDLSASLNHASAQPACSAQQVFNEDSQTYDWQMVCD